MNHDHLFKDLLTTFFQQFIELFLPQVAQYIDWDTPIQFLDKEIFTDISAGEKHIVDLVVKARFRGEEAFFLIHVENQAAVKSNFPRRMFTYFARLHEKFSLPVYPVVIFSHNTPKKLEASRYEVAFPDKTVLQFDYTVIQLNQIPWRSYINQQNPVATALIAKMKMEPGERPKVKLEALRILATLRLDPARTKFLGVFIESYLILTAKEMKEYERDFEQLTPSEQEATMEMMTSWHREGLKAGRQEGIVEGKKEGKEELVIQQINRVLGSISPKLEKRLYNLSMEQLNELGLALFDFKSVNDLQNWLSKSNAQ